MTFRADEVIKVPLSAGKLSQGKGLLQAPGSTDLAPHSRYPRGEGWESRRSWQVVAHEFPSRACKKETLVQPVHKAACHTHILPG